MIALDIGLQEAKATGTAFYRLPKEVKEFFEKCREEHEIIGFDWNPDSPWNFGLILKERENNAKTNSV